MWRCLSVKNLKESSKYLQYPMQSKKLLLLIQVLFVTSTLAKFTTLMQAAQSGSIKSVQKNLLYVNEIDDEDQFSALTYATFNNNDETTTQIINILIKAGEEINHYDKNGYTPLLWAAQNNNMAAAKALVSGGAGINPRSTDQHLTPLLVAVASGHKEMTKYLLVDVNVDENVRTAKHITALISATSAGDKNVDIVNLLLLSGARVDDKTLDLGISALHIAAQEGFVQLTEALIKGGADVNKKNNIGATPLMMASVKGHYAIVQILLDNQADPAISIRLDRDPEDPEFEEGAIETVTPTTMALSAGHKDISELLERYIDL